MTEDLKICDITQGWLTKKQEGKQVFPDRILEAVGPCKRTRKRKVMVPGIHRGILSIPY